MSVLVVQLADAHFAAPDDPLLGRVDQLVSAILLEVDSEVDAVHLVIAGDMAQSGALGQFDLAAEFLRELRSKLTCSLEDKPVELVMVPGNHDCDHSGDQSVREVAIDGIAHCLEKTSVPGESLTAALVAPLKHYFAFAERLAAGCGPSPASPFYGCINKRAGLATIRYHLFNTAWMSRPGETPGSLYFPMGAIGPMPDEPPSVAVCVLHHPFNWFKQPAALRPLREKVEAIGDLILTAHEHVGAVYGKDIFGSGGVHYVEGAVLQERGDPALGGFHTIRIEFSPPQFVFASYRWSPNKSGHFQRTLPATRTAWEPASARASTLRLTDRFISHLEDPGLPVTHRARGSLKLSDFFTFPDLGSIDDEAGNSGVRVRAAQVVESMLERERVVIAASEKGGKTSLGKRLFAELHTRGYAPLLLRGEQLPRSGLAETLREKLRACVGEQYESLSPEAYDQLPPGKRVLIVDDLHKGPPDRSARNKCLRDLGTWFDRTVLLTNTQSLLDEFLNPEPEAGSTLELDRYARFFILPFGHGCCEKFIRQWVALSPNDDPGEIDVRVNEIRGMVGDLLNTTAIPHLPWVILVLVQMADSPEPPVAENGSYGHLLNAVITAAINRVRVRRLPLNGVYAYLGELARRIFDSGREQISVHDARGFHAEYVKAVGLSTIEFSALIDDLCEATILERRDGEITFQHKYTYCFFVAWSLAQRLNDADAGALECVELLSQNLFKEDSADVIVFLANLTSNRVVLEAVRKRAAELLEGVDPSDLVRDVSPINGLTQMVREVVLPDGDPEHNRSLLRERMDDRAAEESVMALEEHHAGRTVGSPAEDKQRAAYRGATQFASTVRTIEILGQVLRNGASVRKLDEKARIAEEVFSLSRRALGFVFANAAESLPPLISRLERVYRDRFPGKDDLKIAADVCEHIFNLAWFYTFAIVKHVAAAVGDENLDDTFERVLRASPSIVNQVFDLAIRLDRPQAKLPAKLAEAAFIQADRNALVQALIRSLVAEHLYLYKVREPEKQAICGALNIKLGKRSLDPKIKKQLT